MVNKDYDRMVTDRIKSYHGQIISRNETDQLGASLIDLNGFAFLQFTILTKSTVKTIKGGTVKMTSNNQTLEIPTDTEEIESDFSHEMNIGILDFDIDLEDEVVDFFNQNEVTSLKFAFEKIDFEFSTVNDAILKKILKGEFEPSYEEE